MLECCPCLKQQITRKKDGGQGYVTSSSDVLHALPLRSHHHQNTQSTFLFYSKHFVEYVCICPCTWLYKPV